MCGVAMCVVRVCGVLCVFVGFGVYVCGVCVCRVCGVCVCVVGVFVCGLCF